MKPVRCRGCGRQRAVAPAEHHNLYCDDFCAADFPVSENEERDSLIDTLAQLGWTSPEIEKQVNVTAVRVRQIIERRKP